VLLLFVVVGGRCTVFGNTRAMWYCGADMTNCSMHAGFIITLPHSQNLKKNKGR